MVEPRPREARSFQWAEPLARFYQAGNQLPEERVSEAPDPDTCAGHLVVRNWLLDNVRHLLRSENKEVRRAAFQCLRYIQACDRGLVAYLLGVLYDRNESPDIQLFAGDTLRASPFDAAAHWRPLLKRVRRRPSSLPGVLLAAGRSPSTLDALIAAAREPRGEASYYLVDALTKLAPQLTSMPAKFRPALNRRFHNPKPTYGLLELWGERPWDAAELVPEIVARLGRVDAPRSALIRGASVDPSIAVQATPALLDVMAQCPDDGRSPGPHVETAELVLICFCSQKAPSRALVLPLLASALTASAASSEMGGMTPPDERRWRIPRR